MFFRDRKKQDSLTEITFQFLTAGDKIRFRFIKIGDVWELSFSYFYDFMKGQWGTST